MTARNAAIAYAKAIRNKAKQEYAIGYVLFVFDGEAEPTRPAGLSFMGGQAVRHNVNALVLRAGAPENEVA